MPLTLPSACGNGRYFVYTADNGTGSDIWRADVDGANSLRLTSGGNSNFPTCSTDGKWVVYKLNDSTGFSTARISIAGGTPIRMADQTDRPESPIPRDSKMVALGLWGKTPALPTRLKVLELETGKELYSFERPAGLQAFRWSPDGRALDYSMTKNGVGNIWEQPLSGKPATQLTHFESESISDFDWSFDGKQFLVSRGHINRNVLLISNFH